MGYSQENIDESKIISYLNGDELSDEERADIANWLDSTENQAEARKLYQVWELSVLAADQEYDVGAAFDKFRSNLKVTPTADETPTVSIRKNWWYAAAASIVLIIAAIWILQLPGDPTKISSGKGSVKTILADGSIITLNKKSSFTYYPDEFAGRSGFREVMLTGEAYYEVAHNPDRPFIVKTHDVQVEVLGTKFLVKTIPDKPTEVLVTEGKVKVTILMSGESYILTAKEQISAESNEDLKVEPSDVNKLYWKTGVIEFPGTPLDEVISVLEKEFGVEISVENEELFNCNITVTLKKQSIETIMKVIDTTLGLQHEQSGDKILIKGDGCQ
ncbi:MAG: FecR domain-containing protein [Bacteroidota bacterium]